MTGWIQPDNTKKIVTPRKFNDPIYSDLKKSGKIQNSKQRPSDWFIRQRAYPDGKIPDDQPMKALAEAREMVKMANKDGRDYPQWSEAGPTNIPGRITYIAVHPDYPSVIYVGAAAGGVFKSTDMGLSWTPIFDDIGTPSIGAIAIHPYNPDILYVGTGEANSAGDSYVGTGVYKTTDAGLT